MAQDDVIRVAIYDEDWKTLVDSVYAAFEGGTFISLDSFLVRNPRHVIAWYKGEAFDHSLDSRSIGLSFIINEWAAEKITFSTLTMDQVQPTPNPVVVGGSWHKPQVPQQVYAQGVGGGAGGGGGGSVGSGVGYASGSRLAPSQGNHERRQAGAGGDVGSAKAAKDFIVMPASGHSIVKLNEGEEIVFGGDITFRFDEK